MLTAAGPKFTREPNVGPAEERETDGTDPKQELLKMKGLQTDG